MTEKVYHIYANDKCIYHSLSEDKFAEIWEMLHQMVEIVDVRFSKNDLSYEELIVNKEMVLNSSH